MLQWMGGSRRKVTTSRKSTHKRQKQYFEQRKRQQQYQQPTAGLESYTDGMDISEEHHREHRSLDVISLLNLSKIAQECRSPCPSVFPPCTNTPGRKDLEVNASKMEFHITNDSPIIQSSTVVRPSDFPEVKETTISLNFQEETASPKKISSSAPDSYTNAPSGVNLKLDQWNTAADQPLSVLDLLGDDELNGNIEEKTEHEAHVAFSVKGLGKVGIETPVHSPQQPSRAFSYGFFSPLKAAAGKLNISKTFNSLYDDLEIEDARMQDIDLPLNGNLLDFSTDYVESLSSPKQKSFAFRDTRHYAGGSSRKKSYFDLQDEDKWDDMSSFQCDDFFDERERDISWKTRQSRIDDITSENLIYRDYNTPECSFESPHIPIRAAKKVRDKFDILGPTSPFSKHETSEYDCDFFISNLSRHPSVERKNDCKPSQPEERDNSSLQSEESCSSSAVRYQATDDSLSNATSRQPKQRGRNYAFSGSRDKYCMKAFANENKGNTQEDNTATGSAECKNMLDPSRKYQSTSFFQENLETKDNWFFEERCTKGDNKPGSSSFNQNSGTKHSCCNTDIWGEDPFSKFPATKQPVGSNHLFNGFDDEPVAYSPSGHFTPAHRSSKIVKPELPPDSSSKRASKDTSFAAGCLNEPPSLDLTEQESISKNVESKGKFNETFKLGDKICITNESLASEDKVATDASNSKSNDCEGKEAKDQAVPQLIERASMAFLPDLVEQTSPSADITDRSGSTNPEKEDHHAADRVLLPFPSGKKENIEDFGPKKRMGNKLKSDYFDSPGQAIMLQSYVFQFFCVEKRLKY